MHGMCQIKFREYSSLLLDKYLYIILKSANTLPLYPFLFVIHLHAVGQPYLTCAVDKAALFSTETNHS